MNLFEKIFNYQILSRLDESGAFAFTSLERSWLKTMLEHPSAREAFTPETLDKLKAHLQDQQAMELTGRLAEKARSKEKHLVHPLLRTIRQIMQNRLGIKMTYAIRNGRVHEDRSGYPYKLEYSMVKREWYLLWYDTRHRSFMATKLHNILSIREEPADPEQAAQWISRISAMLDKRKQHAVIEVIRIYNQELSRILYAFSCFEKTVEYCDENDTYRIRLTYQSDESEYVLSKIRFLGLRVKVVEGEQLRRRMLESTTKALSRYDANDDESGGNKICLSVD